MNDFDSIRPFNDTEVVEVIERLLADHEMQSTIAALRLGPLNRVLPHLARVLVGIALRREFGKAETVQDFQEIVASYMARMVKDTTDGLSQSGVESLPEGRPALFISNHRDITLDPAFTNYALYHNGRPTVRIAIGDNLLSRPYVSDLMRLNKSFIVNRSAKAPRQMLAALRNLSRYIKYSLLEERESVWLAQREGRAKDGRDRTEPSIIKMLSMSMKKGEQTLSEHIDSLNIVPVAISYELDPCDAIKAAELYETAVHGEYKKADDEDIASIATGISGAKGRVHVAFGRPLGLGYESPEDVAADLDRQILSNYKLFPSNYIAYRISKGVLPSKVLPGETNLYRPEEHSDQQRRFEERLAAVPEPHRPYFLSIYANPVLAKIGLLENQ